MTDESHLMALLEEGNPAPELGDDAWKVLDAAAYLATLEQRISEMTKLETNESQQDTPRQWNRPWLVAAGFVLVLGVGVVVFNQMSPAPVAGPPGIPLEGAEDHPGAAEAFTAVEALYAAFNAGDPAWIEVRGRGSYVANPEEEEQANAYMHELWPELMASDPRINVSGCTSQGFGTWPSVADVGVPDPTGYYFICEITETDALLDIAGVAVSSTEHFAVDNGEVLAARGQQRLIDVDAFFDRFRKWLNGTHPEEAAEVAQLFSEPGYGFRDPATKTLIIDYVEEFVDQSDVYPLKSTDS